MARFSSNMIGAFFIKHVEKMIFAIACVCLLGLAYKGYSTKRFDKTTPTELKKSAEAANLYISRADSWDRIEKFRTAESKTKERIEKSPPLKHKEYDFSQFMATRLRTLGLRNDPELKPVQDMLAQVITAPIVIKYKHTKLIDLVASLDAGFSEAENKGDKEDGGIEGVGGSGVGGEFEKEDKKKKVETGPSRLQPSLALEKPLNPTTQLWLTTSKRPEIRECICVTGLVPYESQWREFDAKLRDAKGWYPGRDRPDYVHLEIQRRVNGGEWADITEALHKLKVETYARYQSHLVPEFVDRNYLHPLLSQQTPPFLDTEYRDISTHPKIKLRQVINFALEEADDDSVTEEVDDPFKNKKGDGKAGGGKKGKTKKEDDPAKAGNQALSKLGGGDMTDTAMFKDLAAERLKESPAAAFKLVRFFDPQVKAGETYEYRVRVWIADPNNPNSNDATIAGDGAGVNAPSGGGLSAPDSGGGAGGAGAGIGGDFKREDKKAGDNKASDEGNIRFQPLKGSDLDPKVRDRILAWENNLRDNPNLLPKVPGKSNAFLRNARPTPWSQPTPAIKVAKSPARFYAGGAVRRGFETLIDKTSGKTYRYFTGSPFVSMVVNQFDRDLDIEVPGIKNVYAGDILNFTTTSRFLNPLEWTIHTRKFQKIKSDAVVVGITGGERVSFTMAREGDSGKVLYSKEKPKYTSPAEVLLLDANGNFILRNEIEDKMAYRQNTFKSDEELDGKPVVREKKEDKKDDEGGRRNRRGGNGDF